VSQLIGDLLLRIGPDDEEYAAVDSFLQSTTQGLEGLQAAAEATDIGPVNQAVQALGSAVQDLSPQLDLFSQAADTASESMQQLSLFDPNSLEATDELFGSLSQTATEAGAAVGSSVEQLSSISDAAALAALGLGEVSDSEEKVKGSAEEAEGGLAGMAEQFTVIAESLAVTEGLAEFGKEALGVYEQVQNLSGALVFLGESEVQASESIEKLKAAAVSLSEPIGSVLSLAQQIPPALGGIDAAVPILTAAADAAHVLGTSFEGTVEMLERMAVSGVASSRTLATLKITLTDLGTAMGVSASDAAAFFKDLDATDRVEVLISALGEYSGASEALAGNLTEQWTNFKNQFDSVLDAVGSALAPVVSQLISAGSDILSVVKRIADQFALIPQPVQDAVVAFGLAAAGAVPLTGALAAGAFSINALGQVLPGISSLLQTMGFSSESAAKASVNLANEATDATSALTTFERAGKDAVVATQGLASAGTLAANSGGGMASTLGGLAAVALPAVIAGVLATESQITSLDEKYKAFSDDLINNALANGKTKEDLEELGVSAGNVQAAIDSLSLSFLNAKPNVDGFDTSLVEVDTHLVAVGTGAATVNAATQKVLDGFLLATQRVSDLKAGLDLATAAFAAHAITQQQLAAIQNAYNSAVAAMNGALGKTPDGIAAVDAAAAKLTTTLVNAQATLTAIQALWDKGLATDAQLGEALGNLAKAQSAYNDVVDKSFASNQTQVDALKDLTDQLASGKISADEYTAAINASVGPQEEFVQSTGDIETGVVTVNGKLQQFIPVMTDVQTSAEDSGAVIHNLTGEFEAAQIETGSVTDAMEVLVTKMTDVQQASDNATKALIYSDGVYQTTAGLLKNLATAWDAVATAAGNAATATDAATSATKAAGDGVPGSGGSVPGSGGSVPGSGGPMDTPFGGGGGTGGGGGRGGGTSLTGWMLDAIQGSLVAGVSQITNSAELIAAGLVQVGNAAFETLSQYNDSIKATGFQMNALGQLVYQGAAATSANTTAVSANTSALTTAKDATAAASQALQLLGLSATESNQYLAALEGLGLTAQGAAQDLAYMMQQAQDTGVSLGSLVSAATATTPTMIALGASTTQLGQASDAAVKALADSGTGFTQAVTQASSAVTESTAATVESLGQARSSVDRLTNSSADASGALATVTTAADTTSSAIVAMGSTVTRTAAVIQAAFIAIPAAAQEISQVGVITGQVVNQLAAIAQPAGGPVTGTPELGQQLGLGTAPAPSFAVQPAAGAPVGPPPDGASWASYNASQLSWAAIQQQLQQTTDSLARATGQLSVPSSTGLLAPSGIGTSPGSFTAAPQPSVSIVVTGNNINGQQAADDLANTIVTRLRLAGLKF
jgi:hypothetical protein